MDPRSTIAAFDAFLAGQGEHYSAIVIGGTALALLGAINRPTRDCDVLDPAIPPTVAAAARRFALQQRTSGDPLADDWLNQGPATLAQVLPTGWRARVVELYTGQALRLQTLGRTDLLASKLFALCDRGTDLGDCLALRPGPGDLASLLPWLEQQDANPDWPAHVRATIDDLARRLHGL